MGIIEKKVELFIEHAMCDCGGEFISVNSDMSNVLGHDVNHNYLHICNKCHKSNSFSKIYPNTRQKEVDPHTNNIKSELHDTTDFAFNVLHEVTRFEQMQDRRSITRQHKNNDICVKFKETELLKLHRVCKRAIHQYSERLRSFEAGYAHTMNDVNDIEINIRYLKDICEQIKNAINKNYANQ